jgi:hemerythrin
MNGKAMALAWREQFSVGNDLIDSDHRYLIEIINKAEQSLKTNNRAELTRLLEDLARYGKSHFEREELVAAAAGYTKADQLHVSHAQLNKTLAEFQASIGDTWSENDVARFTAFLRDWLINHVIKEDMLMKPWLTKFSPRFDPR